VLVAQQSGVEVANWWKAERVLQEDLAGGGFEQVSAADDFGDALVGVINDASELVAWQADIAGSAGERATPDEEVAEVGTCCEGLWAEGVI